MIEKHFMTKARKKNTIKTAHKLKTHYNNNREKNRTNKNRTTFVKTFDKFELKSRLSFNKGACLTALQCSSRMKCIVGSFN